MRRAIVYVTVAVELEIDTDRHVTKLENGVLNDLRFAVGSAVNYGIDNGLDFDVLGHYVVRASAESAELAASGAA